MTTTLILHVSSGARLAFDFDTDAAARDLAAQVRDYWRDGPQPPPHRPELAVRDDDGTDCYLQLAQIVGVQLQPIPDPPAESDGPQSERPATVAGAE